MPFIRTTQQPSEPFMPKTTIRLHAPVNAVTTVGPAARAISAPQTIFHLRDGLVEAAAGKPVSANPANQSSTSEHTGRTEFLPIESTVSVLPEVSLEHTDPGEPSRTRRGVLESKRFHESQRAQAFTEYRGLSGGDDKTALHQEIRWHAAQAENFERHLSDRFVPQHGPEQFLSPRAFFVSPLFRVRSKTQPREKHVDLELPATHGKAVIRYVGPELRQSDGLVFLALVHMLRDVQVGTAVSLQPEAVCTALFGRYDGNSRRQLREHIQRLQQGLLIFETFSVQMCLRFDYPKTGRWTVALDRHITELFRLSPAAWFALRDRLALPDGLATWLYTFVSSQTRLIPMKLSTLSQLCGSDAGEKAFSNRMREAMKHLATCGVVDTGWSVGHGEVRWRKPVKSQ